MWAGFCSSCGPRCQSIPWNKFSQKKKKKNRLTETLSLSLILLFLPLSLSLLLYSPSVMCIYITTLPSPFQCRPKASLLSSFQVHPFFHRFHTFWNVSWPPASKIAELKLPSVRADLRAATDRDPECAKMVHCFLYYKGFLALQAHRVAHQLWLEGGSAAAALLLQSRTSEAFAVDIHPGARIGAGALLDHATGVVVGETAVVGDDVSILHGVTLGGTGKESGDRHPKIGDGVLVGAGMQILGNVEIGEGAMIGAGSVVHRAVPPRTTAVGSPARLVGGKQNLVRLEKRAGLSMDRTSWSDYVI